MPGDRVAWTSATGSYAERVLVSAERAVEVPEAVSAELAAAVLLQGMTAHYLATSTYPIRPRDDVLVHAAAGGVGLLLTQIAKLRGARVIATASTAEKRALAREHGADEVISYDGFAEAVRELTAGAGVHVVYDGIGRDTFAEGLTILRPRGLMALYGAASGQPEPLGRTAGRSRFALRHPADPARLHRHARRSARTRRAGVRVGGDRPAAGADRRPVTRSRTRAGRTRISRRGARAAS